MLRPVERRQMWRRIVGLERRGAPLPTLMGHALPDPTLLFDEDFIDAQRLGQLAAGRAPWGPKGPQGPGKTMVR